MTELPAKISSRITRHGGSGCWLWSGSKTSAGYGNVRHDGTNRYVHRLVYEHVIGPIPDGLTIDHLCRVRHCCNPQHLEPVTQGENNRRAKAILTTCPRGHLYDQQNTYISPKGERRCRTCAQAVEAKRRGHRRVARKGARP